MKRFIVVFAFLPAFFYSLSAQEVGTSVDSPPAGHVALQFSYEHLSRDFTLDSLKEEITQEILKATLRYRPSVNLNLYGFVGSSDFPNSIITTERNLYFGGGIKYVMLGEVEILDEKEGTSINIKGGMGLDFQVSRLQSTGNQVFDNFGLTEFQGAIDFGIRVFQFAGYFGFKLSTISGNFTLPDKSLIDTKGKGLFSMFLGFNYSFGRHLAFISEFSFFTESSWALGLRWNL